jgi:glycosyltransferase involved in cell wall biosynthesis
MPHELPEKPVILHAMLARGFGGIEAAYLRYTEALLALGYRVVAVTAPDSVAGGRLPTGVEKIILPQFSEWDPGALWRAWRILERVRPNLILTHGNRAGRIFQRVRGGIPQITVLHRARFKGLSRYDRVITVTEALKQDACAAGLNENRVMAVPNFLTDVPPEKLHPDFIQNSPPVIGFLGRFVPEKGLDLLIDSLNLLHRQGGTFQAVIGGDGPERSAIEKTIASCGWNEKIRLLGWVDDAAAFYRQLDVLCVPSRVESFGLIILEAWAQGVPTVATRTSGPESLINHEDTGLLAAISAESLAENLSRMLSDATLYKKIVQNSGLALDPYRMEAILPRLRGVLESVLSR